MIKTWRQRCEEHPDHDGIVSEGMIQARMQEEIDELRAAIKSSTGIWWHEPVAQMNYRKWQGLTDEEIAEVTHLYDWTAAWTIDGFARAIEARLREKNT